MNKIKIKILGCGPSVGVPLPGCVCSTCMSNNLKNYRSRTSLYIEYNNMKILIDSGPDLRQQFINNNLKYFDAVLYTHFHADHIFGINDLSFSYINTKKSLNIFATEEVIIKCINIADHLFKPIYNPHFASYVEPQPVLLPNIIDSYQKIVISENCIIDSFEQQHGKIISTGYKIGCFAYSPDFNYLTDRTIDILKNAQLKLWIVPLTDLDEKKTHIGYERLLGLIEIIKPQKVITVHMNHHLEYSALQKLFSLNCMEPAFDGMEIEMEI